MGKFFVGFSNFTTATSAKTAIKIVGASAKKFEVVECEMSGAGTVN